MEALARPPAGQRAPEAALNQVGVIGANTANSRSDCTMALGTGEYEQVAIIGAAGSPRDEGTQVLGTSDFYACDQEILPPDNGPNPEGQLFDESSPAPFPCPASNDAGLTEAPGLAPPPGEPVTPPPAAPLAGTEADDAPYQSFAAQEPDLDNSATDIDLAPLVSVIAAPCDGNASDDPRLVAHPPCLLGPNGTPLPVGHSRPAAPDPVAPVAEPVRRSAPDGWRAEEYGAGRKSAFDTPVPDPVAPLPAASPVPPQASTPGLEAGLPHFGATDWEGGGEQPSPDSSRSTPLPAPSRRERTPSISGEEQPRRSAAGASTPPPVPPAARRAEPRGRPSASPPPLPPGATSSAPPPVPAGVTSSAPPPVPAGVTSSAPPPVPAGVTSSAPPPVPAGATSSAPPPVPEAAARGGATPPAPAPYPVSRVSGVGGLPPPEEVLPAALRTNRALAAAEDERAMVQLAPSRPAAPPKDATPSAIRFPGPARRTETHLPPRPRRAAQGTRARLAQLADRLRRTWAGRADVVPGVTPPHRMVLIGAACLVAAVVATLALFAFLDMRQVRLRQQEVQQTLQQGDYGDYLKAARLAEEMGQSRWTDHAAQAEAAYLFAKTALEFGAPDHKRAETLLRDSSLAGAPAEDLRLAQAAVRLAKGDVANAAELLTGDWAEDDPRLVEWHYLRALLFLRRENFAAASDVLAQAVKVRPQDPRLALRQAEGLYGLGQYQQALQSQQKVLARLPDNVGASLMVAMINIETGRNPEEGNQIARRVTVELSERASPGQLGWAHLLQARYRLRQGQRARAGELLASAEEKRPAGDPAFSCLLAQTWLELGNAGAGQREASRALALAPTNQRYRLLLAQGLLEQGDLAAATAQLEKVPAGPRVDLLRGRVFWARGELDAAAEMLTKAAASEKQAPDAAVYLGRIHLARGHYQEAAERLEELVENPAAPSTFYAPLSEALWGVGLVDHAQMVLERAGERRPGDPLVAVAQSRLARRAGDLAQARQVLAEPLTDRHPSLEALVALGEVELAEGQLARAAEAFDRVVEVSPAHREALLGRASVALHQRELTRAEELLARVAPVGPQYQVVRGRLELRRHRPEQAETLLSATVEALPPDAEMRALLGDAHLTQGGPSHLRQAVAHYEAALQHRPGFAPALVGLAEAVILTTDSSGRAQRAVDRAWRAVEARGASGPLAARALAVKGRLHFEFLGDVRSARRMLTRALEQDTHLVEAHLALGYINEDVGRASDACAHYRRYADAVRGEDTADAREAQRGVSATCRD